MFSTKEQKNKIIREKTRKIDEIDMHFSTNEIHCISTIFNSQNATGYTYSQFKLQTLEHKIFLRCEHISINSALTTMILHENSFCLRPQHFIRAFLDYV